MNIAPGTDRETAVRQIESQRELESLCARLAGCTRLAVDSEFERERTYFPKLCLVQITDGEEIACIDPLALNHLEPLEELLASTAVVKVFHAGRQDLELFYNLSGRVPAPLFDTQIAAGLLGYAPQIGYAALVEDLLGVRLEKAHTRANWTRRPLAPELLHYAADDVRYLVGIDEVLREKLREHGRLEWAEYDSERLADARLYRPDPASAWRRIRGLRRLGGRSRRAARQLAEWREETAIEKNRPRQWLLRDAELLSVAKELPQDRSALTRVLREPGRQWRIRPILELVREASAPSTAVDHDPQPGRDARQTEVVDAMMRILRERCRQAGLDAGAVGSRKELKRLLRGDRDIPLLESWRYEFVGRDLIEFVEPRPAN